MRRSMLPKLENNNPTQRALADMQDTIMSSDGESSCMNALPPHIAARFLRSSKSRRKTSAASSRRNSMTSLHSNRSNLSGHGGPQSTHIAQHLRRASIIESRKARLADKAAHAEQVRLRAALAKAAPRCSATREDRALAAQQARERYLAQVAANCAEEVKRAKRVAEEMKEKKAAEHLKLKGNMEGRLADAEKRRILYQQNSRRNRFTNLVAVEEKKVILRAWKPRTEEAAAKVIQRAWRNRRSQQTISQFLQLDFDLEKAQQMSFDNFSAAIAQEDLLRRTAKVLNLYGLRDGEGGGLGENTAVRFFLCAYLIFCHSDQVLSHDGEQEQDLIGKAKSLIMCFERMVPRPPTRYGFSPTPAQVTSLVSVYTEFQAAFTAWKAHDSSILISSMIAQFVELDAIWQTVKNDTNGRVADDYKEGIQKNQAMLLVRLKRLAGPEQALKMVSDAVRARRRIKARKSSIGDINPRGSSTAVGNSPYSDNDMMSTEGSEAPLGPSDISRANDFDSIMSPLPSNRIVVHELAIDENFSIDVLQQSELRSKVADTVFNRMQKDLDAGHGDHWILSMAAMIRDRLLRVVSSGSSLHHLISETLDIGMIEKQLKMGGFSYEKFFLFMDTILPKLCAPARDAEVKALAQDKSDDFIGRLAKLMHIVELLSLDYANYQLRSVAPGIAARAAEYESRSFAEHVANRKLIKATRWWSCARAKLLTETSHRSVEGTTNYPPSQPSSDKIYTQGLIDLFISVVPLQSTELPETLQLDEDRIQRIRADILRIITISTILLTAKNLLKRDVRSQWKAEAQRMWDLPSTFEDAGPYLSIIESAHILPPSTRTSVRGTIERVLGDARSPQTMTQPVMKVLLQKLKNHSMSKLGAISAQERIRSSNTASDVLAGSGMGEFVARIGNMIDEMNKVKSVDWAAHGKWLDEIAAEAAKDAGTNEAIAR